MSQTPKPLNTLDYVQMLLEKSSKTIMTRENTNENRVHLYGVGQYWAAFDKSAFLLEKMTDDDDYVSIIRLKDYPFPILMHCVHYEKVKGLCRKHIMAKKSLEYLQLMTHPIDQQSYSEWYREYAIDEDIDELLND